MKRNVLAQLLVCAVTVLFATTAWTAMLGTQGFGGTLSTLVEIDPADGKTLRTIGPVGYAVNGLEYDATTGKLYGSTSVKDPAYSGLIEIDMDTGAGTPIGVDGWGLDDSSGSYPVTNITVDSTGHMFGWWQAWHCLVSIDKTTGIATLVDKSNVNTYGYGLDFDNLDELYMVNGYWDNKYVYTVDPSTGLAAGVGDIGTKAHHGDFDLSSNLYYGISDPHEQSRSLVVADLSAGSVISTFAELDDSMHTLTFVPYNMDVDIDKAKIDFKDKPSSDKYDVKGEITVLVKASDGINPLGETVNVRVGTSSLTIPFGSFEENEKGAEEYKCHCVIDGVKVKMKIKRVNSDVYKFDVKVDGVDLSGTANPVDISLEIGNDRGDRTLKLKGKLDYKRHKAHD